MNWIKSLASFVVWFVVSIIFCIYISSIAGKGPVSIKDQTFEIWMFSALGILFVSSLSYIFALCVVLDIVA